MNDLLRKIPKIDKILNNKEIKKIIEKDINYNRAVIVIREEIDKIRKEILDGKRDSVEEKEIEKEILDILAKNKTNNFKKVINATGTILHTNLGRSILSKKAIDNIIEIAGNYNNLEYNIDEGVRGSRYDHIEKLISNLLNVESSLLVNNNASAVFLILNTFAKGKETIVSRGELVEIGGSFRIPSIMSLSGSELVEVGTTNRTHLKDYEEKITENTAVILKVHTSNYKVVGFTKEVTGEEISNLSKKHNIISYEDLGSGVLIDLKKYGINGEKTVQKSIKEGLDLISFSGDKLLGGSQVGIIVGKKHLIDKIKKNQFLRTYRVNKLTIAALEETIKYYYNEEEAIKEIPTLNMILKPKEEVKQNIEEFLENIRLNNLVLDIVEFKSVIGGGSMPGEEIDSYSIKLSHKHLTEEKCECFFRNYKTPIITKKQNENILLDFRTVFKKDFQELKDAFYELDNLMED